MGGCCASSATGETYQYGNDDGNKKPQASDHRVDHDAAKQFTETMEFISIVPLFKRLPPAELPRVAAEFQVKQFTPGTVVITQGEMGNEFFVIKSGEAKVTIKSEDNGAETHVATLKKGDYFGEASLLRSEPRNATVTVNADATLVSLSLTREHFDGLNMREKVNFPQRKAVAAIHKARRMSEGAEGPTEKTAEEEELIQNAVRSNEKMMNILHLDAGQIKGLTGVAWRKDVPAKTQLIKQGDIMADHVYIVQRGGFDIFVEQGSSGAQSAEQAVKDARQLVGHVGAGACFGELALLYHAPRAATVQATQDSQVWCVGRNDFKTICMNKEDQKAKEIAAVVNKIELFQPLLGEERDVMAKSMVEVMFNKGDTIIERGADGDTFWLLISGEVEISQGTKTLAKLQADFSNGECPHFGERALISNEPRAATVKVMSSTATALCLDRETFSMTLGSLEDLLKTDRTTSASLNPTAMSSGRKPKAHMAKPPKRDQLQKIGLLGVGGFGSVTLEKDKQTGKTYALKSISKGFIVKMDMQESVMNEKSILLMTDSQFIIKLYATYNTGQYLLFLMEAALGGELFSVYHRKNLHGSEPHAKFYSACVIKAFEHLHERRIIYRDLKPENLLLDDKGYCKLTDMGLAKFVIGKTYTTCGTPDYFAPEVIASTGHSRGVDWWTLGVLIFEFLTGHPPFETSDPLLTYKKIIQGIERVRFSKSHFNEASEELILSLCKKEASERLPMRKDGVNLLMKASWFKSFSWESLVDGTYDPPLKPKMKSVQDTSNFYAHEEDQPPHVPYIGGKGQTWDKNFATET